MKTTGPQRLKSQGSPQKTDHAEYSVNPEDLGSSMFPPGEESSMPRIKKDKSMGKYELIIAAGVLVANIVMLFFGFVLGQLFDVFKEYLSIILCCIFQGFSLQEYKKKQLDGLSEDFSIEDQVMEFGYASKSVLFKKTTRSWLFCIFNSIIDALSSKLFLSSHKNFQRL